MRLQHIEIHPALQGYIEKMWVFENSGRVSNDDLKLIVPNGLIKLTIPFRNGNIGKNDVCYHTSKEHQMTLIGMCDLPAVVDIENDAPSGTIGVEFSPMGAYRFFGIRQNNIKNQIHLLEDVLGKTAKDIQERIANSESIEEKVTLLQYFLLNLFRENDSDLILEYCIRRINTSKGSIQIKQLEIDTGYSSRWLNMKFDEKVGIGPKNLCSITRFQFFYQALARNNTGVSLEKDYYNLYYDQAHFIKDFKRFTGLPPIKYENQVNDFGKIFLRE